jgi:hypothetical protein
MAIAHSRRSLWALVICIFVFTAGHSLVSRSAAAPASACTALREWAQPYAGRLVTLDELARFDHAHRLAIYNAVAPEVRAALWREQMRRLGERSDLTAAQHALTEEAITLMTPALYRHEAEASRAFKQFSARAEGAFTAPDQQRAWFDLGSVVPGVSGLGVGQYPDCNCHLGGGTSQCGGTSCVSAACNTFQGCGTGGLQICNGMCQ